MPPEFPTEIDELAASLAEGGLSLDAVADPALRRAVAELGLETFVDLAGRWDALPGEEESDLLARMIAVLPEEEGGIRAWFEQGGLRLLSQAAGAGGVRDDRPGPIYATAVGGGVVRWAAGFPSAPAGALAAYPLGDGDDALAGALWCDGEDVVVDPGRLPADGRWRGVYLAGEPVERTGPGERRLLLLCRGPADTPATSPVALVRHGRLVEAWTAALAAYPEAARRAVLVLMIFAQMEVLADEARRDVLAAVADPARFRLVVADLDALPGLIDGAKVAPLALLGRPETTGR